MWLEPRGVPVFYFLFLPFKNSATAIRIKVEIGAPVLEEICRSRAICSSSKNVTCRFNFFSAFGMMDIRYHE